VECAAKKVVSPRGSSGGGLKAESFDTEVQGARGQTAFFAAEVFDHP